MTGSNLPIFVILVTVVASAAGAQSVDVLEELKSCAGMSDQAERLACYDSLGERMLRADSADDKPMQEQAAQPEAVVAAATEPQPLPDDLGKSSVGDGQAKNPEFSGFIKACKQGHYGDWYFIFDNGQVWKETRNSKLRFRECNFNATITKTTFGYRLKIEGLDKTYSVRRHQ